MVQEVLPVVPYRQIVFTIPRMLRKVQPVGLPSPAARRASPSTIAPSYGELCRTAYASTRDFLRQQAPAGFPRLGRAVPAMVVAPQSFGDLLVAHPHAHAVVSLGLFSSGGVFHRMEDVDFSGLEELFRERFFDVMLRRQKISQETVASMKAWPHSGFHVNWDRRIEADDRAGLEGLLSYMERAPVSLRRLTYRSDGLVHYQGTKVHPRLGTDHQLLPAVDFLAMLVPHILLRYEVTIRSYGAASTTIRRRLGWISKPPVTGPPPESRPAGQLGPDPGPPAGGPFGLRPGGQVSPPQPPAPTPPDAQDSERLRARRRSWARLIAKVWRQDPQVCRGCGKPMKIVAAISHPAQDDVIEKILRCLGLWDPPWRRQRQQRTTRGPPPPTRAGSSPSPHGSTEALDPPLDVEQYLSDPSSPNDWDP